MARFRDRQDRERYMDSLERQMEHQRQEIQRTLDQLVGSGRRRTALEKLRSSLPSIPGRSSVREVAERERTTEKLERGEPRTTTGGPQEARERPFTEEEQEPRPWWRRMFGG